VLVVVRLIPLPNRLWMNGVMIPKFISRETLMSPAARSCRWGGRQECDLRPTWAMSSRCRHSLWCSPEMQPRSKLVVDSVAVSRAKAGSGEEVPVRPAPEGRS